MKTLLFDFENPAGRDRSIKEVIRQFGKVGAQVVSSDVEKTTTRRAGVTFRNVGFTFADGQIVTLSIKDTGDVFEVRVNNSVVPLRYQDDHIKAIAEVSGKLDKGRAAFQKKLAMVRLPMPPSIKISRPNMLAALIEKRDTLASAVAVAKAQLLELSSST